MNILNKVYRYLKKRSKNLNIRNKESLICVSNYKDISILYKIKKIAFIEKKLINNGIHSKNILDIISTHIEPNSLLIDIGANIGTISLPIAKLYRSKNVIVHSFEASSTIFEDLNKNIKLNNLENIHSYNFAVTSFNGKVDFYEVDENSDNKGLSSTLENADILNPIKKEVSAIKIDNFVEQFSERVSVIKMDIQGSELDALKGSISLIQRDRPVIIFEHEDRYHKDPETIKKELIEVFKSLSYEVYSINSDNPRLLYKEDFNGYVETNLIALPSK
tara:strand:- start:2132 stop:2959 length:828 start_codon:yes stop_codon:yes gene_type:complete